MKKLFAALIAILLSMGVVFGISGCTDNYENSEQNNQQSSDSNLPSQQPSNQEQSSIQPEPEPEFTANAPYHVQKGAEGVVCKLIEFSYDKFIDYLNGEFKNNSDASFFVWEPNNRTLELEGYMHTWMFAVMADRITESGEFINPKLLHYVKFYDEQWGGTTRDEPMDGFYSHTFEMLIISVAVDSDPTDELSFEFGINDSELSYNDYAYYVNAFVGESCIATCYYSPYSEDIDIPLSWYENYFKTHLFFLR